MVLLTALLFFEKRTVGSYALSLTYANNVTHHLLEQHPGETSFLLNGKQLIEKNNVSEAVLELFGEAAKSQLQCRLVSAAQL